MSTSNPTSRIPQPIRLLHPSPSPGEGTRKGLLPPQIWSSSSISSDRNKSPVPKYQLQDPGVVPGSPKITKRTSIRPSPTRQDDLGGPRSGSGSGSRNRVGNRRQVEEAASRSSIITEARTKRNLPSASLWSRPTASTTNQPVATPKPKHTYRDRISVSPSTVRSTSSQIPPPRPSITPTRPGQSSTPDKCSDYTTTNTNPRIQASLPNEHPSPAISICATVATAPSTPIISRSSIPIPTFARSRLPVSINSPAISMCATVATASPPSPFPRDIGNGIEMERETSEVDSIYSSASALALARYRTSLLDDTPTPTFAVDDHELSRVGSTTSFSSASSLARHRLHQAQTSSSSSSISPHYASFSQIEPELVGSIPMSSTTSNTTEEMALVWQPDPESQGSDPAANLWIEIEARLNRRPVLGETEGRREERGQWVLTARQKQRQRLRQRQRLDGCEYEIGEVERSSALKDYEAEDEEEEEQGEYGEERMGVGEEEGEGIGSEEMRKDSSDFTISAYFDPDLSTPIASFINSHSHSHTPNSSHPISDAGGVTKTGMEGTAIFNMSAPLIVSSSSSTSTSTSTSKSTWGLEGQVGITPANTPLIHYETIQRVSRVRKSYSGSNSGSRSGSSRPMSMSISMSTSIRSDIGSINMISPYSSTERSESNAIVDPNPITHRNRNAPVSVSMREPDQAYGHGRTRVGNEEGRSMIRLDSHVQAALEVLSDSPDSPSSLVNPDIDIALDGGNVPSLLTCYSNQEWVSPTDLSDEVDETTPMPMPFPMLEPYDSIPTHLSDEAYPNIGTVEVDGSEGIQEVGLGIGMTLHHDSIYSLPVLSPRLTRRGTSHSLLSTSTSEGYQSTDSSSVEPMSSDTGTSLSDREESQDSYEYEIDCRSRESPYSRNYGSDTTARGDVFRKGMESQEEEKREEEEEEEEEMLTVTDLDTGYRVDLSIKHLDELWRI